MKGNQQHQDFADREVAGPVKKGKWQGDQAHPICYQKRD